MRTLKFLIAAACLMMVAGTAGANVGSANGVLSTATLGSSHFLTSGTTDGDFTYGGDSMGVDIWVAEQATVTLPNYIGFTVYNSQAGGVATCTNADIDIENIVLGYHDTLSVYITAPAAFAGPTGTAVATSNLTWTASGTPGSAGGLLTPVFGSGSEQTFITSDQNASQLKTTGLTWSLATPAFQVAGEYTMTATWRVDTSDDSSYAMPNW